MVSRIDDGGRGPAVTPVSTTTTKNSNPILPTHFYTPSGTGLGQSFVTNYHVDTAAQLAAVQRMYNEQKSLAGAGVGAERAALQDRLRFGLEGLGLDREQIGLDRESLEIQRRNMMEAAISNALSRGIYNSGVRIRNQERVDEAADLAGREIDIREKRIGLSEKELRSSIKNALRALNERAAASRRSVELEMQLALEELERQRRQQLAELISQYGGVYDDATQAVPVRGGVY